MSLFIFDTDILTLFERMHPAVIRNIFFHLAEDIQISSITIEEQISGWFKLLRTARTPQEVEVAHTRLAEVVRFLGTWDIITFSAAAEARYQALLRLHLNVGGNDLRIAAIALEAGATVVTGNLRDFRRVPGLLCEDWSV